ncbi:MAG TPA: flagellar hook-length control protein FliK [Cellvibrionaceae bacterium]
MNFKSPAQSAEPDDFGRVFQQQDSQQLRQKDNGQKDNKSSEGREQVKDKPAKPVDKSSGLKTHASGEPESADTDYERNNKNIIGEDQPPAISNNDVNDSTSDSAGLDANTPWPFWIQHIQAVTPKINADADNLLEDNAHLSIISSDVQKALTDQLIMPTEDAINVVNSTVQIPDNKNGLMLKTQLNAASLNFAASNVSLDTKNSNDVDYSDVLLSNSLQSSNTPNATPQDITAFSSLTSAGLTGVNFKSLLEGATPQVSAQLTTQLTAEFPTLEFGPMASAQDAKWVGHVENTSYPAGMSVDENKSFFQLRFNQQTLAPDLAEKTGWLIEHKLDTAQIQLDPPELGPITVKIHTHQDQVSVTFIVNSAQVKDAMDQTMQRLKDLLHEQGIELSHADVNGQRQQRDNPQQDTTSNASVDEFGEEELLTIGLPETVSGVDHFV